MVCGNESPEHRSDGGATVEFEHAGYHLSWGDVVVDFVFRVIHGFLVEPFGLRFEFDLCFIGINGITAVLLSLGLNFHLGLFVLQNAVLLSGIGTGALQFFTF